MAYRNQTHVGAGVGGELERAVLGSVSFFLRVHVRARHAHLGWSMLRSMRMHVRSSVAIALSEFCKRWHLACNAGWQSGLLVSDARQYVVVLPR